RRPRRPGLAPRSLAPVRSPSPRDRRLDLARSRRRRDPRLRARPVAGRGGALRRDRAGAAGARRPRTRADRRPRGGALPLLPAPLGGSGRRRDPGEPARAAEPLAAGRAAAGRRVRGAAPPGAAPPPRRAAPALAAAAGAGGAARGAEGAAGADD